jgi:hypothetical protein
MTFRSILFALALALGSPACAGETPPSASATLDPAEQATLQSFGASHPECVEWSDGCAVCKRTMSVGCSTPGIACEPRDIACKAP